MTAIENKTGMTREQLEANYIAKINFAMRLGLSETEARELVQESLKDAISTSL